RGHGRQGDEAESGQEAGRAAGAAHGGSCYHAERAMAGSVDTLVHGGQVVTPSGVLDTGIAIDRGRIVALGAPEWLPSARGEIDARGKVVLPGGIDCHVPLGPEYDAWAV